MMEIKDGTCEDMFWEIARNKPDLLGEVEEPHVWISEGGISIGVDHPLRFFFNTGESSIADTQWFDLIALMKEAARAHDYWEDDEMVKAIDDIDDLRREFAECYARHKAPDSEPRPSIGKHPCSIRVSSVAKK